MTFIFIYLFGNETIIMRQRNITISEVLFLYDKEILFQKFYIYMNLCSCQRKRTRANAIVFTLLFS